MLFSELYIDVRISPCEGFFPGFRWRYRPILNFTLSLPGVSGIPVTRPPTHFHTGWVMHIHSLMLSTLMLQNHRERVVLYQAFHYMSYCVWVCKWENWHRKALCWLWTCSLQISRSAESPKYLHIPLQCMYPGMYALVLLASGSKSKKKDWFYFTLVAECCLDSLRWLSGYSCLVGPASIALLSAGTLEYLLESLVRGAFNTTHRLRI